MHSNNPLSRVIFLTIFTIIMLSIFALIVRRGSVAFWINIKFKTIVLVSIWMIAMMILGIALSNFAWKSTEIIGTFLIRIIYGTRIIGLLLIFRDIVSIWYKIPPTIISILSLLLIWTWIYFGTTSKITKLNISNEQITSDYKIVFISDLHVQATQHTKYIQRIVNKIQKINPDLILIWWDLMNVAKVSYVDAFLPFNQIESPIYATLWNHDNMWNSGAISSIFEKTKIIPLRNKSTTIDNIQIVWIDDKTYRKGRQLAEILDESQIEPNKQFTILVSHQPQSLSKLDKYPIDLELAGHTHHGQFWPISRLIRFFNDYSYWEYNENWKIAFVSQWIGSRWAPIRLWTQSEIVVISLKSSKE